MKILIRSSQSKPASLPDTFNNPEDLLEILADTSSRPDNAAELIRKTWDAPRLEVRPYKLDEAANWKAWVAMLGIRVKGLRFVGQVRISMRKDIDAASYGRVEVSEIRGATPQPEDILLIAKKYMADPEPYKIVTLLTVDQAAEIRRSFAQPEGVAPRRVIQEKVRKKVENLVPACVEQGLLPLDGAAYLTNW
ncbi:unnamed protein product, partial [Durusdinium trenchii]